MHSLGRLFASLARLKAIRLFLFNQDVEFSISEVAERTKLSPEVARMEVAALAHAGLIRRKGLGRRAGFIIDRRYEHLVALEAFIRATTAIKPADLLLRIKRAGTPRLVILSGFFTGIEAAVDLLVVGDQLKDRLLIHEVRAIEAELGREIRYAVFSTADFRYRLGVYDRLIRDVLDYPHRVLLDKIGL